ncbi:hypothetical protein ACFS6F_05205, partial [Halobacillus naozhouensis]
NRLASLCIFHCIIMYFSIAKHSNTHGLNLVLGKTGEKSRVMYVGHENNGFDISPKDTKILRGMLDNQ